MFTSLFPQKLNYLQRKKELYPFEFCSMDLRDLHSNVQCAISKKDMGMHKQKALYVLRSWMEIYIFLMDIETVIYSWITGWNIVSGEYFLEAVLSSIFLPV